MSKVTRELARTIHSLSSDKARRERTTHRAEITDLKPDMLIRLYDTGEELDDDEFELSQSVRLYDDKVGLEVGDTLLVIEDGDDYLVADVFTDNDDYGKLSGAEYPKDPEEGQVLGWVGPKDDDVAWVEGGGGPGSGDLNYVHNQGAAAAVWTVNHNLGKYPAVHVVDTGGSVVMPDVHFDSANALTVTFGSATSGKAYVN